MIEFIKKNRLPLFVLFIIVLSFIVVTAIRIIHAIQVDGQWTEFDSQSYMHGENNPDGFRMEYPQGWTSGSYEGGGQKNLGDLRASFSNPFYVFTQKTFLSIWWRRVDETWTLEDVRDWYIEENGFGINRSELEQKRNSFQERLIGSENYPALSQVFSQTGSTEIQIVLFIVGDEAFVLEMNSNIYELDTFNRMLNSFEVYE
ncbi:MAG: hypothetical protein GY805_28140 [Chloroflexi bacterium]|nr:hypothetical protein [Chloroflexota bacterium]